MVGLKKKKVTYAKISQKMVNPRDLAGNVEDKEEDLTEDSGIQSRISCTQGGCLTTLPLRWS